MSCAMPGCSNIRRFKPEGISFHSFPKGELLKTWLRIIGKNPETWKWTRYKKVCSLHFTEEDYVIKGGKRNLKINAIPCLPTDAVDEEEPPLSEDIEEEPCISEDVDEEEPSISEALFQSDPLQVDPLEIEPPVMSIPQKNELSPNDARNVPSKADVINLHIQFKPNTGTIECKKPQDKVVHCITVNQFDKICRTCLSFGSEIRSIDDVVQENISISFLLENYAAMKAVSTDNLPQRICNTCVTELMRSHTFKEKCAANEKLLQSIYNNSTEDTRVFIEPAEQPKPIPNLTIIFVKQDENPQEPTKKITNIEAIASITEQKNQPPTSENAILPTNTQVVKQGPLIKNKLDALGNEQKNQTPTLSNATLPTNKQTVKQSSLTKNKLFPMGKDEHHQPPKLENEPLIAQAKKQWPPSKNKLFASGTQANKMSLKCEMCSKVFHNRAMLVMHKKETGHRNWKICAVCGKMFSSSNFWQHMRSHTKEKPHVCKICHRGFSISANLKRHIVAHTGEKRFVCIICGKGFTQKVKLIKHVHLHSAIYETEDYLKSLDRKYGTRGITCHHCGSKFGTRGLYQNHLKEHSLQPLSKVRCTKDGTNGENVSGYICHDCGKPFKTKTTLKTHLLTHGEKTKLCQHCGRGFNTNTALNLHLMMHTGDSPHKCLICDKCFLHAQNLERHMYIHTGEKPFKCDICPKTFTQHGHLSTHKRTHSGERPYRCKFCDKSFALNGNLTVHQRMHTGETPYLCPVCGKGFRESTSMKKHVRRHDILDTNLPSSSCESINEPPLLFTIEEVYPMEETIENIHIITLTPEEEN